MDCKQLTDNIIEIQVKTKALDAAFDGDLDELQRLHDDLADFVEPIYEGLEPDQITKRDRIAKELGLSWLDKFHEGLAWGREKGDEKFLRLVTDKGQMLDTFSNRRFNAQEATPFKDGIAWAKFQWAGPNSVWTLVSADEGILDMDVKYGIVDFTSEDIYPAKEWPANQHAWSLVKHNGEKLSVNGVETFHKVTPFHDGRAWVQVGPEGPFKLIDTEGNIITDYYFESVRPFSEGKSMVRGTNKDLLIVFPDGRTINAKKGMSLLFGDFQSNIVTIRLSGGGWSYYQLHGDKLTDLEDYKKGSPTYFENADAFTNGFAKVKKKNEDHEYFIDARGINVFDEYYVKAESFSEGAAAVIPTDSGDERWTYINTDGKPLFLDEYGKPKYFSVAESFKRGVAKVFDDPFTEPYYINKKGERMFA